MANYCYHIIYGLYRGYVVLVRVLDGFRLRRRALGLGFLILQKIKGICWGGPALRTI